jgi:hypothetical protein
MDEDTALVVTGIISRPIAKVAYNFLPIFKYFTIIFSTGDWHNRRSIHS